ncbi:hypothetical protein RS030_4500 [Cryptosporidium xiaoi]|uniref:Uncharacterized protein n=1 Tax=Cryptosporidium xiaoi TaxID=659607 RepID=A0AAV9XWE2_9CRYT
MISRCVFFLIILTLYIFNVGFVCNYSIGLSNSPIGYSFLKIRNSYNLRVADSCNDDDESCCCSSCCSSCCSCCSKFCKRLKRLLRRQSHSDLSRDDTPGVFTLSNPSVTSEGQETERSSDDVTDLRTPSPDHSVCSPNSKKLDKLMGELEHLWKRWKEFNCPNHPNTPACVSLLNRITHLQNRVDRIINN